MQIRKGTEEDIPAIVELLKSSLGEGLIKKSADLWYWKHVKNPFGPSPVLVAEEDGQIIGVRAFLQWKWLYKGRALSAIRAVDTATHPQHQGKGIFKKLTLKGLEDANTAGIDFVFNTPNQSSMPGYLKMGWVEQGKMPLKLQLNPFSYKRFSSPSTPYQDWGKLEEFLPGICNSIKNINQVYTALSPEYIIWRYRDNPLFDYYYLSDYKSFVLFYRIKQHLFGQEMRIVDLFVNGNVYEKEAKMELERAYKDVSRFCFLVSASGRHYDQVSKFYPSMGLIPVLDKGPIVTLKKVALPKSEFELLLKPRSWSYSLGDMELF